MRVAAGPHRTCLKTQLFSFHSSAVTPVLLKCMFWTASLSVFVLSTAQTCAVCALRLCPSQWRGGLVYEGMDKGSFDDVTSSILRRHQKNLCLSLLTIYGPSSSSSTSSSPFASSQRKSAFQQPASGLGRYVCQLLGGRRRSYWSFCDEKMLQCLIFRTNICESVMNTKDVTYKVTKVPCPFSVYHMSQ